ncbi:MAG: hypothetical protein J0I06_11545 [Planctomycetes bacterium]|nr:hypothetical protein [Planctomycetota bacterium]
MAEFFEPAADTPGLEWQDEDRPWHAKWDGKCRSCGRAFSFVRGDEFVYAERGNGLVRRHLRVDPAVKRFAIFFDEDVFLAGFRITVRNELYYGEVEEQEVFISLGELLQLVESLKTDLAPLLDRYDWGENWT